MNKLVIDRDTGLKAIYGGLFLGGGGGGSLQGGLDILEKVLSYGDLKIYSIDEFNEEDIILTASLVGSPASKDKYVDESHYKKVYDLYKQVSDNDIKGIMSNEVGAQAITNGWMLSAMEGIPLINATCNGRAHPTGSMGSMGLSTKANYLTIQTAAGGKDRRDISISVKGTVHSTSEIVKITSVEAGGFVTVLRNPINIKYINDNAAVNSINYAVDIGEVFIENKGNVENIVKALKDKIDMQVIGTGVISQYELNTVEGLDLGFLKVKTDNKEYEVVCWNEYMNIDDNEGNRIASFPDLISVLDSKDGIPILSSELKVGMEVILVNVPKNRLILGKSMFDMSLLKDAEKSINKELVKYF